MYQEITSYVGLYIIEKLFSVFYTVTLHIQRMVVKIILKVLFIAIYRCCQIEDGFFNSIFFSAPPLSVHTYWRIAPLKLGFNLPMRVFSTEKFFRGRESLGADFYPIDHIVRKRDRV